MNIRNFEVLDFTKDGFYTGNVGLGTLTGRRGANREGVCLGEIPAGEGPAFMPAHHSNATLRIEELIDRLHRQVSYLVHSGALTERRLALMVGISQPHLHNILNGVRRLTPANADLIMERLHWSGYELLDTSDLMFAADQRRNSESQRREVPYADPGVGPEIDFPGEVDSTFHVETGWLKDTQDAIVVGLEDDPEMTALFGSGDLVLVSRETQDTHSVDPNALYIVRTASGSVLRWVRFGADALYLVSARNRRKPLEWQRLNGGAATCIAGRVVAYARGTEGIFRPANSTV